MEQLSRTLKERCVHRDRFETLQNARRVIGFWVGVFQHSTAAPCGGHENSVEVYALCGVR